MVQLRFVPSFRVTKLVIATDCEKVPISPGMVRKMDTIIVILHVYFC